MLIHNIAITGLFQQGKSLTVNCLLETHASLIGMGVATTRKVTLYQLKNDIFISDTPGFESTGINAANDTFEAETAVSQADFIVFVVPNQQLDQPTLNLLFDMLHKSLAGKPLALLMNCQDRSNLDTSLQNPLSEINLETAKTFSSQLGGLQVVSIDGKSSVFTYNPAWYWYGLVDQNNHLVENLDNEQKEILRSINYTISIYREYEDRAIPAAEFMVNSRLGEFKTFLEERFAPQVPQEPLPIVVNPGRTRRLGW